MSMKLLLLGPVIGTVGFLAPAYADVVRETWDFSTQLGDLGPSHPYVGATADGTPGTTITATAFGPFGQPSPNLFGKDEGDNEVGLGLTNDPLHEITPGSFIQLDLSKIDFETNSVNMSFQAVSTTDGEEWQVWGSNRFGAAPGSDGTMLLGFCTAPVGSVSGNSCEGVMIINGLGNFMFADVTSSPNRPHPEDGVLLAEIDTVPGPIVGAGLPGLIAACSGLIALARRRRRQLA